MATRPYSHSNSRWRKGNMRDSPTVRGQLDPDQLERRTFRRLCQERENLLRALGLRACCDRSEGDLVDCADSESEAFYVSNALAWHSLVEVERALGRLSEGSYGTCESCGRGISKARLQAVPSASLCLGCKQKEESASPESRCVNAVPHSPNSLGKGVTSRARRSSHKRHRGRGDEIASIW